MSKQNSINPRFTEYFRETFFKTEPEEFESFMKNITKPLPKTIRVNTNRISVTDFMARAIENEWRLTATGNPTVFRIDRDNTTMPLGHTSEHLLGYFYIQELSASMSVHYLTCKLSRSESPHPNPLPEGEGIRNYPAFQAPLLDRRGIIPPLPLGEGLGVRAIDPSPCLILDMAASPGGKTTQLAEHFPNAFIIANEPTRDRTAQLVQNVERMGAPNVALSNYDGIFFGQMDETFDRVLLDAPCSGEGIGFKAGEALKFWNIKNITKIARLQEKLLDAGFRALKTGGEMLYSTCTLNNLENEGVVNAIRAKYPESFEVLFEKRFWPHREETGGFFVCRIRKNAPIEQTEERNMERFSGNTEILPLSKDELRLVENFEKLSGADFSEYFLFRFKKDILAIQHHDTVKSLMQQLFFIRLGKKIGRIEDGVFIPDNRLGRDFALPHFPVYEIADPKELDDYLRRAEIGEAIGEWYSKLRYNGLDISLEQTREKTGKFTNTFPREWMRG